MLVTERDNKYFTYIKIFGFSNYRHMRLALNMTRDSSRIRLNTLKKNGYLRDAPVYKNNNEKILIPGHKFYDVFNYNDVYQFKISQIFHDLYLLYLYTGIKKNWTTDIQTEQEIKKNMGKKAYIKIPDLIVGVDEGNFIIEYEREDKGENRLIRIYEHYSGWDQESNYFIYICETQNIAQKIKKVFNLSNIAIIKPQEFLDSILQNKFPELIDCVEDKSVNYF